MRWLVVLFFVLATVLPLSAEDWITADGKTYKNVVVIGQEDDGVRITYDGGAGKIPYYELPVDLQKKFGQDVDSVETKRKAAEKAMEDATRNAAAAAAATAAEQKKEQDAAAAAAQAKAQQNAQSGTQPGAQPAAATSPNQPSAKASTSPAPVEDRGPYSGGKLIYNPTLDVSYLDCPVVEVVPDPAPETPNPPGQGTTLTLRITTEGRQPQIPEKIKATFLSVSTVKRIGDARNVQFIVDGTRTAIDDVEKKDNDFSAVAGQVVESVTFYVPPKQARSLFTGNNVSIYIGSNKFIIEPSGIATFQKYLDDVDKLPPPATTLSSLYEKFMQRLPSILTVVSVVCEYIVLGSFTILVAASIAAFVMGVSRFMKM